jgi:hypothetical protein
VGLPVKLYFKWNSISREYAARNNIKYFLKFRKKPSPIIRLNIFAAETNKTSLENTISFLYTTLSLWMVGAARDMSNTPLIQKIFKLPFEFRIVILVTS